MCIFVPKQQEFRTMKRKIMQQLMTWKNRPGHKPLILKGARQVGKTYILEEFGRRCYASHVKVSLDLIPDVRNFLQAVIQPMEIIAYLESMCNTRIVPGETLVILDEIQDCRPALLSLKYFQEDCPQYDIVAAGSLLGVAVNRGIGGDPSSEGDDTFSYPVGKVDELRLFPMDFEEFLWATGNDVLAGEIREHFASDTPLPDTVHALALDFYQKYLVVGGMPESVKKFVDTHSYLECRMVQQTILDGYDTDMGKYATASAAVKIRSCFNSIPAQLAKENRKFQYKLAMRGGTAKIFGEALEWLILAGVAHKCKLVTHGFVPLSAQEDDSDFKIYMSDIGLLDCKAQMPVQMLLGATAVANTFLGAVAENYIAQTLASNGIALHYWKNANTQEVDFVMQDGNDIIPVEVKKGKRVNAISMGNFMKTYSCPRAYRISAKNFGFADGVKSIPLYAAFCMTVSP